MPTQLGYLIEGRSRLSSTRLMGEVTNRDNDDVFREFAESIVQHIDEAFFWRDPDSLTPYFVSHAYERIWGQPCQSAYANPSSWIESIHPDDRDRVFRNFKVGATAGPTQMEYR